MDRVKGKLEIGFAKSYAVGKNERGKGGR